MTIENKRAEMLEVMTEYAEKFTSLGFITGVRSYYTDKSLEEHTEIRRGSETLWCELLIKCEGMDDSDGLVFDLFADIERDRINVKEADSDAELSVKATLDELYETLTEAPDPNARFMEEYKKAQDEFDEQMREFEKKFKRLRYLSLGAAAIVIICVIIIFVASLV